MPKSLFDTVCAFLNTDGGTVYLGIDDQGTVTGVDEASVPRLKREIAGISNNPQKLDPPYLLFPKDEQRDGKTIIVLQIPLSSQIHRHLGEIYLRSEDGDYRVKGTHQLAGLLNRKLGIFPEQTPLPAFSTKDLRPELFDRARELMRARNQNTPGFRSATPNSFTSPDSMPNLPPRKRPSSPLPPCSSSATTSPSSAPPPPTNSTASCAAAIWTAATTGS